MSKNRSNSQEEHIIARILKFGIYIVAFIPLVIFSEFLSPFHFGKVIVFRSIVEIMLVLYALLLLTPEGRKKYLPSGSVILWAFIILTAVFGLTSLTGVEPYQSFWGTLERMGGWFTFTHYLALFVMMVSVFKDRRDWIRLLQVTLFVSMLSAFYGYLQKTDIGWIIGSGGRSKIFGTIGNPALFAGYMVVNAFLALTMFFSRDTKPGATKNFYFAVFLIDSFAILLTGVRGSVLGWVVGVIVFGFLSGSKQLRKFTIIFILIVIASASTLYALRDAEFVKSNQYLDRYADLSPTTYTIQTRTWAWGAGIDGWNDSAKTMFVGYGPENFNYPFSFHFNPKFYAGPGSETLFDRAHNMFVEVLVTMGVLGLAAYIFLFVAAFKVLRRLEPEDRDYKVGFIALIIAYMIHNSFIFDTSANFIVFFTILGFIYFLDPKTNKSVNDGNGEVKISTGLGFLGIILFLVLSIFIYKVNIRPVYANYATTRAIIVGWQNKHGEAIEKYKEALSYDDVPIKYEIRHRYAKYIIGISNTKGALDLPEIVDAVQFGLDEVHKNIEERPQDYLPLLYAARLNIMLGKDDPNSAYNDAALELTNKALEISPTFVRSYFELGQAYINKKDYKSAREAFQTAYELNPETTIAAWYLGISYIEEGQIQKGIQIIEESGHNYKSSEGQTLKMVDVFVRVNNFWKVAEMYEALVAMNPINPQYHASLAVAYAQTGRIDQAVAAARKAAELDPSFAAESQVFINSITGEAQ